MIDGVVHGQPSTMVRLAQTHCAAMTNWCDRALKTAKAGTDGHRA
jgi:hypothetical protein